MEIKNHVNDTEMPNSISIAHEIYMQENENSDEIVDMDDETEGDESDFDDDEDELDEELDTTRTILKDEDDSDK